MSTRKLNALPGIIVNPGGSGSGQVEKVDFNNVGKPLNCVAPTDPGDGVNLDYLQNNYKSYYSDSFQPSTPPFNRIFQTYNIPALDLNFRFQLSVANANGGALEISNLANSTGLEVNFLGGRVIQTQPRNKTSPSELTGATLSIAPIANGFLTSTGAESGVDDELWPLASEETRNTILKYDFVMVKSDSQNTGMVFKDVLLFSSFFDNTPTNTITTSYFYFEN